MATLETFGSVEHSLKIKLNEKEHHLSLWTSGIKSAQLTLNLISYLIDRLRYTNEIGST